MPLPLFPSPQSWRKSTQTEGSRNASPGRDLRDGTVLLGRHFPMEILGSAGIVLLSHGCQQGCCHLVAVPRVLGTSRGSHSVLPSASLCHEAGTMVTLRQDSLEGWYMPATEEVGFPFLSPSFVRIHLGRRGLVVMSTEDIKSRC